MAEAAAGPPTSSATERPMSSGALYFSSSLMASMPRSTITTCKRARACMQAHGRVNARTAQAHAAQVTGRSWLACATRTSPHQASTSPRTHALHTCTAMPCKRMQARGWPHLRDPEEREAAKLGQ